MLSCFIVLVIYILFIFYLIKIAQLQFDWDELESTIKKHDFWKWSVFAYELFIYMKDHVTLKRSCSTYSFTIYSTSVLVLLVLPIVTYKPDVSHIQRKCIFGTNNNY